MLHFTAGLDRLILVYHLATVWAEADRHVQAPVIKIQASVFPRSHGFLSSSSPKAELTKKLDDSVMTPHSFTLPKQACRRRRVSYSLYLLAFSAESVLLRAFPKGFLSTAGRGNPQFTQGFGLDLANPLPSH